MLACYSPSGRSAFGVSFGTVPPENCGEIHWFVQGHLVCCSKKNQTCAPCKPIFVLHKKETFNSVLFLSDHTIGRLSVNPHNSTKSFSVSLPKSALNLLGKM